MRHVELLEPLERPSEECLGCSRACHPASFREPIDALDEIVPKEQIHLAG